MSTTTALTCRGRHAAANGVPVNLKLSATGAAPHAVTSCIGDAVFFHAEAGYASVLTLERRFAFLRVPGNRTVIIPEKILFWPRRPRFPSEN